MIVDRSQLTSLCAEFRAQHRRVVFTNGCFDILHRGHVSYLKQARDLGDLLVIGLNTDASVKALKGPTRPINNELDRAYVLDALRCVDYVCLFDEATPLELIRACLPSILVKGGDYTPDTVVGAPLVREHGGEVRILPFVDGKSTSAIIEKIMRI